VGVYFNHKNPSTSSHDDVGKAEGRTNKSKSLKEREFFPRKRTLRINKESLNKENDRKTIRGEAFEGGGGIEAMRGSVVDLGKKRVNHKHAYRRHSEDAGGIHGKKEGCNTEPRQQVRHERRKKTTRIREGNWVTEYWKSCYLKAIGTGCKLNRGEVGAVP